MSQGRFAEASYGDARAPGGRILVAYATANGSTAGVADAIGKQLASGGVSVDVRHVGSVRSLQPYAAVVVGSAIQNSKWLPDAAEFVRKNRDDLKKVPTALFIVCMVVKQDNGKSMPYVKGYLDPVRAMVRPVSEGYFAGAMRFKDHPYPLRLALRFWFAITGLKEGDHRDWQAIRAWADATRPRLTAGSGVSNSALRSP